MSRPAEPKSSGGRDRVLDAGRAAYFRLGRRPAPRRDIDLTTAGPSAVVRVPALFTVVVIIEEDDEISGIDDVDEIVVGLDLSPSSTLALHWAAAQARRTGTRLRAVHALDVPPGLAAAGLVTYPCIVSSDRVDAAYREAVSAVWDSVDPEPEWRLQFMGERRVRCWCVSRRMR